MSSLFNTTSSRQHERNLHNPALCEELRIRDILDGVGVMTNGTFVAAYELSGIHSYYHTEDMRNRAKESLEAAIGFYTRAGASRAALWGRGTERLLVHSPTG